MELAVLSLQLNSMILRVFSNLNDSVILIVMYLNRSQFQHECLNQEKY